MIAEPHKHFDWIDDLWLVVINLGKDTVCVYRKHGELPGGKKLSNIIDDLNKIKKEDERLRFENTDHYRIYLEKRGNNRARSNNH